MKHQKSVKLGGPLKEKCLRITITLGPFGSKVQYLHITTVVGGPFESKVAHIHCSCCWAPLNARWTTSHITFAKGGLGKCLACLPLNTPLYITLTMILCVNTKPIEHVLLHPRCILSHLMSACKH